MQTIGAPAKAFALVGELARRAMTSSAVAASASGDLVLDEARAAVMAA